MKKIIIKSLEKIYKIKYNLIKKPKLNYEKEFKKIALILTTPLGIGDLIMMGPVIKSFRKNFPKSIIHLITDKKVYEKIDGVDKIKIVSGTIISMKNEFKNLSKERYDLGVVLARAINQSVYLDKLKPRYKLGYLSGFSINSNFRLIKENLFFDKKEHFSINSLKIIESLGFKKIVKSLIKPKYSNKIKKKVNLFFNNLNLQEDKKIICLNPFVLWESRCWDENNYIKIVENLHTKFNFILYGGSDSSVLCKNIEQKLLKKRIKIRNLSGKLNLKESIEFLKYIDLFICADCGPMHFSFIMKRPTICFFGPVKPNQRLPLIKNFPIKYFWIGDYKKYSMYNYESKHEDKNLNGLKEIKVNFVEKSILKFFKEKKF